MAKYIVIEDFESQWFKPTSTTPQIAVFKKDSIVQALPSPVDGKIVERVIAENVSAKRFDRMFSPQFKRIKENDTFTISASGFYFVKPNGDTYQLVNPKFKKGTIIKR